MPLTILVILAFLIVFPLFWCGVVYLISLFGWQKLAEFYATNQPMPPDLQSASGRINLSRYNHTLRLKADERGLWLKTMLLFSPGHKPLFIPWSAVEHYEGSDSFWLYKSKFRVRGVTIRLNQDLGRWLEAAS